MIFPTRFEPFAIYYRRSGTYYGQNAFSICLYIHMYVPGTTFTFQVKSWEDSPCLSGLLRNSWWQISSLLPSGVCLFAFVFTTHTTNRYMVQHSPLLVVYHRLFSPSRSLAVSETIETCTEETCVHVYSIFGGYFDSAGYYCDLRPACPVQVWHATWLLS